MKSDLEKIHEISISGTGDSDFHLMSIYSIGLSLRPKNILEIGVRDGVTTLPLLMLAKRFNGHLYSVDIEKTLYECKPEHETSWTFVKSCSVDFLTKYIEENGTEKKFDFIYLDGWHSYEHVSEELALLDKLVSPSSIILVHDLMYANWQPHYHCDLTLDDGQWAHGGPYKAVCELNKQFWEFSTIPACNGLTVLRKKYSSLY
jgi:cephalosporin hydroxylase